MNGAICHGAELAADLALARPPGANHLTDPSLKEEITMSRIPPAGGTSAISWPAGPAHPAELRRAHPSP